VIWLIMSLFKSFEWKMNNTIIFFRYTLDQVKKNIVGTNLKKSLLKASLMQIFYSWRLNFIILWVIVALTFISKKLKELLCNACFFRYRLRYLLKLHCILLELLLSFLKIIEIKILKIIQWNFQMDFRTKYLKIF
jgi:hypothetical protein